HSVLLQERRPAVIAPTLAGRLRRPGRTWHAASYHPALSHRQGPLSRGCILVRLGAAAEPSRTDGRVGTRHSASSYRAGCERRLMGRPACRNASESSSDAATSTSG